MRRFQKQIHFHCLPPVHIEFFSLDSDNEGHYTAVELIVPLKVSVVTNDIERHFLISTIKSKKTKRPKGNEHQDKKACLLLSIFH